MNRRLGAIAIAIAGLLASPRASAQADPRFAVDRFEPSERGSAWLANESLDLRGRLRPSFGYVLAYARKPYVVRTPSGDVTPVRDLLVLHLGGSVVFLDRVRASVNLPLQPYVNGESSGAPAVPAPAKAGGVGDLRVGADVRVFGEHGQPITGAIGLQVWAPTGQKSQWMSDGVFRAHPRAMLAGESGVLVWAAQLGVAFRERDEATFAIAAGVRPAAGLVVGPELFASTALDAVFGKRGTPVEALVGAHWLVQRSTRLAGSFGPGLGGGEGAPAWRATFAIEWSPSLEAPKPPDAGASRGPLARPALRPATGGDRDRDGVRDEIDACPDALGTKTTDPRTNGCPPDEDGDGIDDLADACPTIAGLESPNRAVRGCPDRDRDHDGLDDERDACPDDRGPPDLDPRRSGCPTAFVRASRIDTLDALSFKDASVDLEPTASNEALLTAILGVVLRLPYTSKLRVEGHTDDRGDPNASRKLGRTRAAAIVHWLVEHGIEEARLSAVGVGPDRPVATNETEAGRRANRRIELVIDAPR